MDAMEKERKVPKNTYANEVSMDEDYLTTDFIVDEQSKAGDECNAHNLATSIDNEQHDATNVLHGDELPTWVDNSAYNADKGPDYLSPVQYKPVSGNTNRIIGENKAPTIPPRPIADRHPGETMYEEIPNIPEYLELEEFPTQASVQTPAIQTSQTATDIVGAAETNKKNPKTWNGCKEVYGSEDLDDEQYLTTDFIDNEQSQTTSAYNDQDLPTSVGNPQRNTQNVLHIEELPTLIDNSACNIGKDQAYLSPLQYEPVPGMTDLIIDQTMPQTPPPPLPPDRHPSETMYEEIPGIPEYLELEEIPTQASSQQPQPVTITATGGTGGRKRVTVFVTIGVLACIITLLIALLVTNRHPSNNEEGTNVITSTQPQGKFS